MKIVYCGKDFDKSLSSQERSKLMRLYGIAFWLCFFASPYVHSQVQSDLKAEFESSSKCYVSIDSDKRLDVLHSKIGMLSSREVDAPTIELLSEKSKPSKNERLALSSWGQIRQECDKATRAIFDRHEPESVTSSSLASIAA